MVCCALVIGMDEWGNGGQFHCNEIILHCTTEGGVLL